MQAYLVGRGLEGGFAPDVFADLIERLAEGNRAVEAESVLADYFGMWRGSPEEIAPLPERAFQEYVTRLSSTGTFYVTWAVCFVAGFASKAHIRCKW